MSRTYRDKVKHNGWHRRPSTFSELRQLNWLDYDPDLKELGVNLPNRRNRFIPTIYDDLNYSSYEEDWHLKQLAKR